MFQVLSTESFGSIWYWAITISAWTLVCHRTLGVPYDMILRAEGTPSVAAEVDHLAGINAKRIAVIARGAGTLAAGAIGFALAALATLGFTLGGELAQAAFMLLAPLSLVLVANARLALALAARPVTGEELRRALARRRFRNQVIAFLAVVAAVLVAPAHLPAGTIG